MGCIRLILADHIPSNPNVCSILQKRARNNESVSNFDEGALLVIVNRPADGGVTALHMAALNGHVETVHLLLDLGASVSDITVEDGATVKLIGAGCTALHYAACGGNNAQCCQLLIANGASLTSETADGWTPLMVARSWHRDWLENILSQQSGGERSISPSPYLCLPLMSIVDIARECGWRNNDPPACLDPCVVCLERKCSVAAQGCSHEFCTYCALYLCSTSSTSSSAHGRPGSIACPLCRHGILSFVKLSSTRPITRVMSRTRSLPFCTCSGEVLGPISQETPLCRPDLTCARLDPLSSCRPSLNCQIFPSIRLNPGLCMGAPDTSPALVSTTIDPENALVRCSKPSSRRSTSPDEGRRWLCSFIQPLPTEGAAAAQD